MGRSAPGTRGQTKAGQDYASDLAAYRVAVAGVMSRADELGLTIIR
jgi:hypothetical protein